MAISWESVIIAGDTSLARLLKVNRATIHRWRESGIITGKPFGERPDGKPIIYSYNWEQVKQELREHKREKYLNRV